MAFDSVHIMDEVNNTSFAKEKREMMMIAFIPDFSHAVTGTSIVLYCTNHLNNDQSLLQSIEEEEPSLGHAIIIIIAAAAAPLKRRS
jgi:hypothetical protein